MLPKSDVEKYDAGEEHPACWGEIRNPPLPVSYVSIMVFMF